MRGSHCSSHSIVCGGKSLNFTLYYSNRRTMEIAVHRDGAIVVRAPFGLAVGLIEQRVLQRSGWIQRKLDYFSKFKPATPPLRYVDGETHLYLGRSYRLKLSRGRKNSVTLSDEYLNITLRDEPAPDVARKLLNRWYRERAVDIFQESLARWWPRFKAFGVAPPELSIRRMKTRWGSLSGRGRITLNTDLILSPVECIDYVVVHELCHLKHRNHGREFYTLLASIIPDWKRVKERLERGTG